MENNATTDISYEFTSTRIHVWLIIVCFLGMASNVLLLFAFIKDPLKCFRNSGTYFVMNLSVSDCLSCSIGPFYLTKKYGIPTTTSDFIVEFVSFWFGGVSFISIMSISIDRFLLVAYPIKHRILIKSKLIIMWLAAIWIVTCLLSILITLRDYIPVNGRNIGYIFSVIIIIVSVVMYSLTYCKLKKQSRNIVVVSSNEGRAQEIRILKEKRFLKTVIIIALVAFSCVLPSIMIFYLNYDSSSPVKLNVISKVIGTVSLLIIYINYAVNPLIYILRLPNYRKTFCLLYCRRRTVFS